MFARIRRNFCQYSWAPMWDHCGRKDLKQLLSVIDAMGKTGRLPEDLDEIVLVDLYLLGSNVGGTIMVAKIRRNFCQYRMFWERLNRRESEETALLEELLRNFCRYRMSTRM